MIEINFIRHGKTPGNEEARYIGRTDEMLSAAGKKELMERKEAGCYKKADLVFLSPMLRCKQTADLIYEGAKQYEILEFKEMDFGIFEGKNYKELNGNRDYQRWIDSNGTLPFPGGETKADFCVRCLRGFEKLIQIVLEEQKKHPIWAIACVVHGGTIMALLDAYTDGDYFDFQCKNGTGFRAQLTGNRNAIGQIKMVNIERI